jgi:uncharacterized protein (DUF4415 family)
MAMKQRLESYDFSKGRRGAVVPVPLGKTRITIRVDSDILEWFRQQVNAAGGGNYQTLINDVLRHHVEGRDEALADVMRRVVREELQRSRRSGESR